MENDKGPSKCMMCSIELNDLTHKNKDQPICDSCRSLSKARSLFFS